MMMPESRRGDCLGVQSQPKLVCRIDPECIDERMTEYVGSGEEMCMRTGLQRVVSASGDSLMVKTQRMLVPRPEILIENLNQSVNKIMVFLINGNSLKLPSNTYPFTHSSMQYSSLIREAFHGSRQWLMLRHTTSQNELLPFLISPLSFWWSFSLFQINIDSAHERKMCHLSFLVRLI